MWRMDPTVLQRYEARVPRYTSYPTAPHFDPRVDAATYRGWLGEIGDGDAVSLYLHVPFCRRMCWYCGCHTKVSRAYAPVADYAATLAREIELVAEAIPSSPVVTHLHWGGGTPNALSSVDFAAIMTGVRGRFAFAADAEIAVELDPRLLTREAAQALCDAGVTRASLGVQDFNESVQRAINRVQPYALVAEAVGWLRAAGCRAISFDLMYGLPGQTEVDVVRTADLAADLRPDRIALFGYAHVPWMKKHQQMIDEARLPQTAARYAQAEAAAARLVKRGYTRIGLDHFAHTDDPMVKALAAGQLRRNFQGYTTDRAETLLGFGASAIGALRQGYVQNAVPLNLYAAAVSEGQLPISRGIVLSADDVLRRTVIERLMCDLAADVGAIASRFGRPVDTFAKALAQLAPMARDGLVEINGPRVRITEEGRPFMRLACAAFDRYLDKGAGRHSSAV